LSKLRVNFEPYPRAGSGPRRSFIQPSKQVKNIRNVSWTTEILWVNLNFIELLPILQLITIQNSYYGNNIKPQAIKRLVKFSFFYTRLSKRQLIIFSSALECNKNNTLQPLAQKGCAPLIYRLSEASVCLCCFPI